jgi:hypothetical protein
MADVNLVDLEVIKRYSLAIRQESAPAEEVLAVLELSREAVLAALAAQPRTRKAATSTKAVPKKTGAKRPAARKTPAKKTVKAASTNRRTSR